MQDFSRAQTRSGFALFSSVSLSVVTPLEMRQRARRGILRRSGVRWPPHCILIVNAVLEHVPRCTAEAETPLLFTIEFGRS